MFSFFAALFSVAWLSEHWKAVVAVLCAIVLLIVILHRRKKARVVASQNQRQKDERRRVAEMEKAEAERAAAAQMNRNKKEAEISAAIAAAPGSAAYRLEKGQSEVSAHFMTITEFRAAAKNGFVVFDTETTGINYRDDALVEIAAVRVRDGRIVSEYHTLVDPGRPMPPEASSVNHITDNMLSGQPKIHEVLPGFLSFVGDSVLVAHNARFDFDFLSQACMRNRFKCPELYFDTMRLARYYPEAENKKQETLLHCAGIVNDSAHRALGDARSLAQFVIFSLNKRGGSVA